MEPLLALYKSNINKEGYLSQWGSKDLGDKGLTDIEILKYYYGENINIYEAKIIENYPYSFNKSLSLNDCNMFIFFKTH